FGSHQHHRLPFQTGAKTPEFFHDDIEVSNRIRPAAGIRNIDDVGQNAGAFDMPQELNAQASTSVRAFYQSRNISDDVTIFMRHLADSHYAEIWLQCGERIICDLRPGGRNTRNQS